MKRLLAVLALIAAASADAAANTLIVTQPAGGSHDIGSPMIIAWTKDFVASGAAAKMLITVQQRSGDLYADKGLVAEVSVNASPWTWQPAGTLQAGMLPPGDNYHIVLQMKQSPSVAARGPAFSLRRRILRQEAVPAARRAGITTAGIRVYVPNAVRHCTPSVCRVLWDRTTIEQYAEVHYWIRLPNGAIGSRDKVFGTMSNARVEDEFCQSGNCGRYTLPVGIELEPSAGNLYYLELFTMDQQHRGKSEVFAWQ